MFTHGLLRWKNSKKVILSVIFVIIVTSGSILAAPVNLSGTVINQSNQPIKDAIVRLRGEGLIDTTGADGKFSFITTGIVSGLHPGISATNYSINRGTISITSVSAKAHVSLEAFTLAGRQMAVRQLSRNKNGIRRYTVSGMETLAQLLLFKLSIDGHHAEFWYNPVLKCLSTKNSDLPGTIIDPNGMLKAAVASVDTVIAMANTYKGNLAEVTSLTQGNLGNIVLTKAPERNVIPFPQVTMEGVWDLTLSNANNITASDTALLKIGTVLNDDITRIAGLQMQVVQDVSKVGNIYLEIDQTLADETYILEIEDRVTIRGGSYQAVSWGTSTLIQLLGNNGSVPQISITDWPEDSYISVMVDVARQFNSIATLKQVIKMAHLYKVRYFHLHLTDDQAFMFPSTAYPKCSDNNFAGSSNQGKVYSLEELQDLVQFAEKHEVTIIPELDTPGHSTQMRNAYPNIFGSTSFNTSSQTCKDAVCTIISEMLAVFNTTPYFHIGADEASSDQAYRDYIEDLNAYVRSQGKTTIVWEGFGRDNTNPITKDLIVMSYESLYYVPWELLPDGYTIINNSWKPTYVSISQGREYPPEEIYAWDKFFWDNFWAPSQAVGGVRVDTVYTDQIIGGQVNIWEGNSGHAIPKLRPRLPAVVERVWNYDAGVGYSSFKSRFEHTDSILTKLIN